MAIIIIDKYSSIEKHAAVELLQRLAISITMSVLPYIVVQVNILK